MELSFIYCSAACFCLSDVLQILLCVSLCVWWEYVCRGVYAYLYIRERKGRGERDAEAERGRENNLPLCFWWWFISFPPFFNFWLPLLYRMLPKHFHGIHCSYKLFMVAFLPSHLPIHPHPVLSFLCQGTNMASYVQPTSSRSEQARPRRDAMCVEWVCGPLRCGDVARWQMRMECSVSNHRLGKGLPSKPVLRLFEIGSYGFCTPYTFLEIQPSKPLCVDQMSTRRDPGIFLSSGQQLTHVIRAHDHHSFH